MSSPEPSGAGQPPSWSERYANGSLKDEDRQAIWRDFDNAWVMVSELVGATLTWGGLGWLADRWLGLAPILMSVGFILGFATGFYLIWGRTTGRIRYPGSRAAKADATESPVATDRTPLHQSPDTTTPHDTAPKG